VQAHTSAIVDFFEPDTVQADADPDSIDLVSLCGRGKNQAVFVEKRHHILAIGTVFCLPADMQGSAELDLTE
jgi:hypothetical protein